MESTVAVCGVRTYMKVCVTKYCIYSVSLYFLSLSHWNAQIVLVLLIACIVLNAVYTQDGSVVYPSN